MSAGANAVTGWKAKQKYCIFPLASFGDGCTECVLQRHPAYPRNRTATRKKKMLSSLVTFVSIKHRANLRNGWIRNATNSTTSFGLSIAVCEFSSASGPSVPDIGHQAESRRLFHPTVLHRRVAAAVVVVVFSQEYNSGQPPYYGGCCCCSSVCDS